MCCLMKMTIAAQHTFIHFLSFSSFFSVIRLFYQCLVRPLSNCFLVTCTHSCASVTAAAADAAIDSKRLPINHTINLRGTTVQSQSVRHSFFLFYSIVFCIRQYDEQTNDLFVSNIQPPSSSNYFLSLFRACFFD